jgi:SH2 domain-containing protein 3C
MWVFSGLTQVESTLFTTCITPWETSAQDFGFSIMFAHLDSARSFINNLSLYRKNAQIVLADTSRLDSLLEDAFRYRFKCERLTAHINSLLFQN